MWCGSLRLLQEINAINLGFIGSCSTIAIVQQIKNCNCSINIHPKRPGGVLALSGQCLVFPFYTRASLRICFFSFERKTDEEKSGLGESGSFGLIGGFQGNILKICNTSINNISWHIYLHSSSNEVFEVLMLTTCLNIHWHPSWNGSGLNQM